MSNSLKVDQTKIFIDSKVDLWFEAKPPGSQLQTVYIYELKIEKGMPIDLYQLIMYCDGIIQEKSYQKRIPIVLHLIAPDHSEGTKKCCDYLRTRTDNRGVKYDINLGKYSIDESADEIESIAIEQKWYP